MEEIHLPKTLECEYTEDADKQIRGEHSDEMERVFDVMHWNVKEVVISTLGIERVMRQSVQLYFYPHESELFNSTVLEGDFFGYASLLKTLRAIQERSELLEAKEWKELEQSLRATMRYRNMFAHGKYLAFRENNEVKIKVEYFEGKSQQMVFDDARWKKVSVYVREANQRMGTFMSACFQHHANRIKKPT